MNKVSPNLTDAALKICVQKKLYSATDFRDVVRFLNSQQSEDFNKTTISVIKPLRPLDQSVLKAKPEKRDVSDYVAILKGVMS